MKNFSIVPPQKVQNHITNTSPSKMSHAFTKSRRFINANPQCKEAFYSTFSSLSKRKVAIVSGKKFDFTKSTVDSPASTTYKHSSSFDKMNKTYTFAVGREKEPSRSYLYHITKAQNPGPGAYQNRIRARASIAYTVRAKTIDVIREKFSFRQNPGPGTYQSLELNPKNGKFKISKFSDTKMSIINKDKRFKEIKQATPGPLTYKNIDNLNDHGKYVLSHRRGKGTRPFDHEKKFMVGYWRCDTNPGPADYDKPTEFGVYGDSQYYKTLTLAK